MALAVVVARLAVHQAAVLGGMSYRSPSELAVTVAIRVVGTTGCYLPIAPPSGIPIHSEAESLVPTLTDLAQQERQALPCELPFRRYCKYHYRNSRRRCRSFGRNRDRPICTSCVARSTSLPDRKSPAPSSNVPRTRSPGSIGNARNTTSPVGPRTDNYMCKDRTR